MEVMRPKQFRKANDEVADAKQQSARNKRKQNKTKLQTASNCRKC
jgi:hypothetical protein